jgi:Tfp pilus assembly protein PilF
MRTKFFIFLALPLLASGCAGWKQHANGLPAASMPQAARQPTIADQRGIRQDEAIRSFEQHRDQMQLQAALDRFGQGDMAGCESRLQMLVQRRPDFAEARLRLAEICWSRGDAPAAEEHYLAVLFLQPDSAEAHHGLGILLEASGRDDEAQRHLERAAQLDPSSALRM